MNHESSKKVWRKAPRDVSANPADRETTTVKTESSPLGNNPNRPFTRTQTRTRPASSPTPGASVHHADTGNNRPAERAIGSNLTTSTASSGIRLSKRMSELGLASRREADEWIEKGWVYVDGQRITELGTRIKPEQKVSIDRAARNQQAGRVTILLHKPIGYVSGQAEDGYKPAIVLAVPDNRWNGDNSDIAFEGSHLRSLAPAGRLDIDSTGLLVLTQDGRIAKQLIGEDSVVEKEYLVRVAYEKGGRLPDQDLRRLNFGLSLDGQQLKPAHVSWQNDDQLRFILKEGKKRQIRRMCEMVGLKVLGLKRIRIGNVILGNLPQGKWRYLRADESFL